MEEDIKVPVMSETISAKEKEEGEEEDGQSLVVEAPDGGWGWVIVFASFMCNVVVDGIIFSYGLFIPELAASFGESKGRIAWIGSILAGFYLIAGPVVSGFANAYGCRPVTIIGTIVSAASFAISSLAPNMEFLCVTFGLMGGIGFGFIYLPAVVTVGFYFEKKRAFATGLAVCGSGVGTFVMAPFVKWLLGKYSWNGTMLVLSGVILHCAIFGSLFRPLRPKACRSESGTPKTVPLLQRIKAYRDAEKTNWDSQDYLDGSAELRLKTSASLPEVLKAANNMKSLCSNCENSPVDSNSSPPPSYSEVIGEDERLSFLNVHNPGPRMSLPAITPFQNSGRNKTKKTSLNLPHMRPFYRQDILYSASLLKLPEFRSQPNLEAYHASVVKIPLDDELSGTKACCCGCCSPVVRHTFKQMLDVSLLKSPTFLVFGVSGFLTLAGFFVPFMFIVDRAVTIGIDPEQATYILPAIGFTNTVGRIFSGWVSDSPHFNALTMNNVALIAGGLVTIFCPFFNTFVLIMLYGAIFGFSIACFATLRSIIIVDLLGLDKLTNAFGLLLLFQGVATVIGAPVAGMFYDLTGNYDASFYIAGSVILLSGLLSILLPCVSRWEKNLKKIRPFTVETSEYIRNYESHCKPNSEDIV